MIRISKKVDYAIIILAHLARNTGTASSAREIASRHKVSYALVANLLKTLAATGLVTSERGMRGGYRIAKPAHEISLDELIEIIEGPYRFADCAGAANEPVCSAASTCPACDVLRRVHGEIRGTLRNVTIADLAGLQAAGGYPV